MIRRPRGTRDFAPAETARRQHAAARLREVFGRFGYGEVQTPTFEELALFTAKSGEGILGELYDLTDKGGRRLALRPELTAPVMRMYFSEHAFEPKPIKWFYHANCFRYDRPQAGRYREFWQFGCEQIGAGTPLAYAELLALADACFEELGLRARETWVGHVGLLRGLVDALGLQGEERGVVMRLLDKRDDEALRAHLAEHDRPPEVVEHLFRALDARTPQELRQAVESGPLLDELLEVFRHLEGLGVEARPNLAIARGLDYYTGVVFEVHCPLLGAQKQLLGGGGYDLSGVFDAPATPTMGFGLGFDRLLVALEEEGVEGPPLPGPEVVLGALSPEALPQVLAWSRALRDAGRRVDLDLMGRRAGQVAKHADAVGARRLVLLGDRDLAAGEVQVKDLHSGEAEKVPLDGLVARLSR